MSVVKCINEYESAELTFELIFINISWMEITDWLENNKNNYEMA